MSDAAVPDISTQSRLLGWLFRRAKRRDVQGIPISLPHGARDREICFSKISQAFELLAHHDPRRFQRFRRDVTGVMVAALYGPQGEWRLDIGLVLVSDAFLLNTQSTPFDVASLLVHEGTHAWLDHLGFRYTEQQRGRIEAICRRSELSFLRRLPLPKGAAEVAGRATTIGRAERGLQVAGMSRVWTDDEFRERDRQRLRAMGIPLWLARAARWVAAGHAAVRARDRSDAE